MGEKSRLRPYARGRRDYSVEMDRYSAEPGFAMVAVEGSREPVMVALTDLDPAYFRSETTYISEPSENTRLLQIERQAIEAVIVKD